MNLSLSTVDALYAVGHWLLEQTRPDDAVHVFRTMLMTAPQDERAWLGLGTCHERIGHHQAALELYRLGEQTVSASYRCALARARLLRALDNIDAADVAYESAEERAGANDEAVGQAIALERRTA